MWQLLVLLYLSVHINSTSDYIYDKISVLQLGDAGWNAQIRIRIGGGRRDGLAGRNRFGGAQIIWLPEKEEGCRNGNDEQDDNKQDGNNAFSLIHDECLSDDWIIAAGEEAQPDKIIIYHK